jgi:hypothetical protein
LTWIFARESRNTAYCWGKMGWFDDNHWAGEAYDFGMGYMARAGYSPEAGLSDDDYGDYGRSAYRFGGGSSKYNSSSHNTYNSSSHRGYDGNYLPGTRKCSCCSKLKDKSDFNKEEAAKPAKKRVCLECSGGALPKDLNKCLVVDLKKELTKRGLATTGLKAALVSRLQNAVKDEVPAPLPLPTTLGSMSVARIQQELKKRNLPVSGLKQELLHRLSAATGIPVKKRVAGPVQKQRTKKAKHAKTPAAVKTEHVKTPGIPATVKHVNTVKPFLNAVRHDTCPTMSYCAMQRPPPPVVCANCTKEITPHAALRSDAGNTVTTPCALARAIIIQRFRTPRLITTLTGATERTLADVRCSCGKQVGTLQQRGDNPPFVVLAALAFPPFSIPSSSTSLPPLTATTTTITTVKGQRLIQLSPPPSMTGTGPTKALAAVKETMVKNGTGPSYPPGIGVGDAICGAGDALCGAAGDALLQDVGIHHDKEVYDKEVSDKEVSSTTRIASDSDSAGINHFEDEEEANRSLLCELVDMPSEHFDHFQKPPDRRRDHLESLRRFDWNEAGV